MRDPSLVLIVETPEGMFRRSIMPATVLPPHLSHGDGAEDATRNAASTWGLPDFVFRRALQARGSGNRELGDAIVISGERAACVQVKARERPSSDRERERAWLDKKIKEGIRQAAGTIRSLKYSGRTVLTNDRGRRVVVAAAEKRWLRVVVLDHPGVEDFVPSAEGVVLLRRDWEFLFHQLKSTYAVLEYLERVATVEQPAVGQEAIRYYRLAAADLATSPSPIDPRLRSIGAGPVSAPLLPQAPARYGNIIRLMLEDIATSPWPEGADPAQINDMLSTLDALPVAYRDELGATMMAWLEDVTAQRDMVKWRFRRFSGVPGRPHLAFAAASKYSETIRDGFQAYVCLRHQQHLELIPEQSDITTIGVLVTPRHDGVRPWDTTAAMTRGDQEFAPEYRKAVELLWGQFGESVVHDDFQPVIDAFNKASEGAA